MAVVITVALACEARPIIDFYRLKRDLSSSVFNLYRHKELPITLIISGVGKIKMAAAVAYTHQHLQLDEKTHYINLGIAGSATLPLGDLIVAQKIIDQANGKHYFPFIAKEFPHYLADVVTWDAPTINYPATGVVDMEAAAFFVSAGLFVTQEYLSVIKIVSDNKIHAVNQVNKEKVIQLIAKKLPFIDQKVKNFLAEIDKKGNNISNYFDLLTQHWHFSAYQKNQLNELLRRWNVLLPDQNPLDLCQPQSSSKAVLQVMTLKLNSSRKKIWHTG